MSDTYTTYQKLNNNDTLFFVGDTPTVTFNDNVTVFIYPKTVYIYPDEYSNNTNYNTNDKRDINTNDKRDINTNDKSDINTNDKSDMYFRKNRIYAKILLFFKKFIKK